MIIKPFTVHEAAVFLHVKPRTVRNYIRMKSLKANFLGGKYLIQEDELERFAKEDRR